MKKTAAFLARLMNGLLNALLLALAAVILAVSVYSLVDNWLIYREAADASLITYRPRTAAEDGAGEAEKPAAPEFLEGQAAWLCVEDTYIDFPVMRGEDNFEYLNKDPRGEYSMSGSVFMDHRNSADLTDEYILIYGHHMDHYRMFGSLDLFASEAYFMAHRKGWMASVDHTYGLELFAVVWGEGDDWTVFNPQGKTAAEVAEYIDQRACINTGYVPGKRIVALSTCAGETYLSRLLVFGMLTE